jgi:hypothetical protein
MAMLSVAERRRVWHIQKKIGISAERLAHVKQTVEFLGKLRRGDLGSFYSAMLPENRRYEDRSAYLSRIRWVRERDLSLSSAERTDLEAGLRLHDIGYATGAAGDHPEQGYLLLHKNAELWSKLRLTSVNSRAQVEFIVRYHGFFTDIGFLYPAELMKAFSGAEKAALVVINSLDSCAKPIKEKFHNMLFSRLLDRYVRFLEQGTALTEQERLQQLFGPCNYVWLEDRDLTALDKLIDAQKLRSEPGFKALIERGYFICWPLVKDLVTPEIAINNAYFTPVKDEYLPQLVNLLALLSRIAERAPAAEKVWIDTDFSYSDISARQPKIDRLRSDLAKPRTELVEAADGFFLYGDDITLRLNEQPDKSVMIRIGSR